jgi:hypothetical protein
MPNTGNLTWTTARMTHHCRVCEGQVAEPGQDYLRDQYPEDWETVEAFCRACAWRLFGPGGQADPPRDIRADEPRSEPKPGWPRQQHERRRGCLLDQTSERWRELQRERAERTVQIMEQWGLDYS